MVPTILTMLFLEILENEKDQYKRKCDRGFHIALKDFKQLFLVPALIQIE